MTTQEYYEILKREWEKVNKDNLNEIKRYNEMKRLLNEFEGDNLQEKTENYLLEKNFLYIISQHY